MDLIKDKYTSQNNSSTVIDNNEIPNHNSHSNIETLKIFLQRVT